jgi:hypothetical protein
MGYGVPAAVAAKAVHPERTVVSWNGDGCFLMNGQELATAVQYDLAVIFVVVDNGMYGTIRMHQERNYPARVSGTDLRNPDFAALARAYGAHAETVAATEEFAPAFERARASGKPALLHLKVDPQALTVNAFAGCAARAGPRGEAMRLPVASEDGPLSEPDASLERQLEERTRELKNSLEQQAAIGEILRVMAASAHRCAAGAAGGCRSRGIPLRRAVRFRGAGRRRRAQAGRPLIRRPIPLRGMRIRSK